MSRDEPIQVLPVVNTVGSKLAVPIVIPSSKLALYFSLAAVTLSSIMELMRSVLAILHGSGP